MIPAGIIVEILIVGIVLIIAISPSFYLFREKSKTEARATIPILDLLTAKKEILVLLVLLIYPLGIIGNRLSDDITEVIYDIPVIKYVKMKFLQSDKWNKDTLYKAYKTHNTETEYEEKEIYKIAEFKILHSKSGTNLWFERHKSFIRILRAVSSFSLIMIIMMGIQNLRKNPAEKYPMKVWYSLCSFAPTIAGEQRHINIKSES